MPKRSTPLAVTKASLEALESRQLLAALDPTVYEQYMLELVNRARANPTAEASRLGLSSLNEGLAANTIAASAKQPLAMNTTLIYSARNHANYLRVNSLFSHTGEGGSSPSIRMTSAGYGFSGTYGSGENLALTLGSSLGDMTARVETLYRNLFVDGDVAGRGHRLNLLNTSFEEVGVGIANGPYTYNGQSWTGILANQDFAYKSGNAFLTGVIFDDTRIRTDSFYTPGEGQGGATVTITSNTGATYNVTTNVAGGWKLQVPAGTYTIKATSAYFDGEAKATNVVVGAENVKVDFKQTDFVTPVVTPQNFLQVTNSGFATMNGTEGDDLIEISIVDGSYVFKLNDKTTTFFVQNITGLRIYCYGGNDSVTLDENTIGCYISGAEGNDSLYGTGNADRIDGGDGDDLIISGGDNDTISGGNGNDAITGGAGKDIIDGDEGIDRLNGAGGADRLSGGGGNDRVYGGDGDDFLEGGGNVDCLYGNVGNDTLIGGSSNDRLYGDDGDDELWGKAGTDYFDGGIGTNSVKDWISPEVLLNASL